MICPHCAKPIQRIKKNDPKLYYRVRKLKDEGYSVRDIEKMTGVSYPTVSRWTSKKGKSELHRRS